MSEVERYLDEVGPAESLEPGSGKPVERYAITGELQTIEEARRLLEQATSPQEVKGVADYAEAMRRVAQKARLGLEAQNQAAELKIDAQRKGGELLIGMQLHGGDHGNQHSGGKYQSVVLGENGMPNHYESLVWQQVARIPEEDYELFKAEVRTALKELTTAWLLKSFQPSGNGGGDKATVGDAHGFFSGILHDFLMKVNSANLLGGVEYMARAFSDEERAGYAGELERISGEFREWAAILRKEQSE